MKIVLKGVAALVLLLVLLVGALLLFFDPNAYKTELVGLARDQGSVEVAIAGDIGWSLFPNFALALPALTVDDLNGKRLAAVEGAEVSVAILPLLSGRLEMSGLALNGLRLELEAPTAESAPLPETTAPAATDSVPAADATPPQLDVGFIDIRDADIRYHDPQSGQLIHLSRFNLRGDRVRSGEAFPISSSFQLSVGTLDSPADLTLDADLKARLLLDLAQQLYGAEGLELRLQLGGVAFNGRQVPIRLAADLSADLATDKASVQGLSLSLASLQLSGGLEVAGLSGQPQISGQLQAAPFALNPLLQALGQAAVVTQDAAALQQLSFSAQFSGPANTLLLKPFSLRVDDSTFKGEVGYDLGSGRQRLVLQGDRLNLDRYLPPPAPAAEESAAAPKATGERYSKEPLLPEELLQGLNFELQLGLQELLASGLKINQIAVDAQAAGGLVEVKRVSGQLYEGSLDNSVTLDARKSPLRTEIRKKVSGIKLGPLLQDLAQIDKFSGTLALDGHYSTRGNSIHAMVNSLNGSGTFGLTDGRLKGVNLVDSLCQGIRKLKGLPEATGSAPDYTHFSNLSASLKVTDGVVDNRDLTASMVAAGISGAGQVDLPAATLDYGLDLTVLQQVQGERCQIEDKLHNLALPLLCKGSFDDEPAKLCRPDTARMKKALAKLIKAEQVDKLKDKAKTQLEQKLQDKEQLKGALKGLFK